jgi:hypothetical protein
MRRVVGFGLCDAASALMLHAATMGDRGFDGLVLANPWTIDGDDDTGHSPAALRRRYLARLADPRALLRLVTGQVNLAKLASGLGQATQRATAPSPLVAQLQAGLAQFNGPATLLVAAGDRIGARFREVWPDDDPRITVYPGRSHSFTDDPTSRDWLFAHLREATASRH